MTASSRRDRTARELHRLARLRSYAPVEGDVTVVCDAHQLPSQDRATSLPVWRCEQACSEALTRHAVDGQPLVDEDSDLLEVEVQVPEVRG